MTEELHFRRSARIGARVFEDSSLPRTSGIMHISPMIATPAPLVHSRPITPSCPTLTCKMSGQDSVMTSMLPTLNFHPEAATMFTYKTTWGSSIVTLCAQSLEGILMHHKEKSKNSGRFL